MKTKLMPKLGSLAVAACMAFAPVPVLAADNIEVNFLDVTDTADTLKGEAKVQVSVKGAEGNATIAQIILDFIGDLPYKSTYFLKGDNALDSGMFWTAKADKSNRIMTSIIATEGMEFSEDENLFVITFGGKEEYAGKEVTLKLSDLENTYCTVNGKDIKPSDKNEITLIASDVQNVGRNAVIRLKLDKVLDFTGTGDAGITVKITNEDSKGDVILTDIENTSIKSGGHRDGVATIPTFELENTVIADKKYTVEVSGIGYVTYKKTGVTFDEPLEITSADFIPGDVNNDGKVDITDKETVEKFIKENDYSIAADFNRDGKVNKYDLDVFAGIKDESGDNNTPGGNNNNTQGGSDNSQGGGSTGGGGSAGGGGSTGGGGSVGGGGSMGGGGTASPANKETFTDLGNYAWAKDSIYTLKNKGIINGTSETEFSPSENIKRADFILILTRMLKINDAFTENFADVPDSAYYFNAVGSAKAAGIASGDGENFMPEASITRQDLITLAYRAFLNKGYITQNDDLSVLDTFADKDSVSDYAKTAMASMVKAGIIQGSDGNVNPLGNATRAEVAVMCARMLNLMK